MLEVLEELSGHHRQDPYSEKHVSVQNVTAIVPKMVDQSVRASYMAAFGYI